MRPPRFFLIYAMTISVLGGLLSPIETRAADATAPIVAKGYFVDCDGGSDSAEGTSYSAPWRTLVKVGNSVRAQGADVWLKAGTVCSNQTLRIVWPGTQSDRVIVGSYYVSGGVAYESEPSNPQLNPKDRNYPNGRATIRGTYRASCRAWPSQCQINTAEAVPNGEYGALVTVPGTPYVTVQDLVVRDSAGYGILIDGIAAGNVCRADNKACEDYTIVKDNLVSHLLSAGIVYQESRFGVVAGNEVEYQGLSATDSRGVGYGAALTVVRCDPCDLLVENNYMHDIRGETIGPFGVSNVLVRGNYLSNGTRSLIYFDGAADVVAEQNILAGGSYTDEPGLGDPEKYRSPPAFFATALIKEPSTTSNGSAANSAERHIFRNNLISNFETCFRVGITGSGDTDDLVSGEFVGNTCVGAGGKIATSSGVARAQTSSPGIEVANNIFAATSGSPACDYPANSLTYFHHNYWVGSPSNPNCRKPGTGDIYGSYASLGLSAHGFATSTKLDFPSDQWFAISSTSESKGAGNVLTNTYLDASTWSWVLAQRTWRPACQSVQVSATEFVKILTTDYCGISRLADPNMGALGELVGQQEGYLLTVD